MYPKITRLILCLAFAALLLPQASIAGTGLPVVVQNYGDSMEFEPQIEAADMILTVTGPCNYELIRSLSVHERLVFELDETTIDGRYRFEVTVIPEIDGSIIEVLEEARASGDNSEVDALCREGSLPGSPLVQTAGFEITRGVIVYDETAVEESGFGKIGLEGASAPVPSAPAGLSLDKQTIAQSLCVGFDCPGSPSFDDTTILMMENNTRIKFDDTSTISGFPNRDWELEANSRSSGGGNYFAVNDCGNSSQGGCATDRLFTLEASAPQHSLYVDDGGRIGNRTSTPVVDIHVKDGDTPTLRLEQDTSSGFAAQTWDVAGNETSFFVRDATNGSTLPFRIQPGSPSNAVFIANDGDVGMGTTSPTANSTLHVVANTGSANDVVYMENNSATRFALSNTNHGDVWRFNYANSGELRIGDSDGDVEFQINGDGDVEILGGLITTGGGGACTVADPCDDVFHPEYELPSIEEHAAEMWQKSYLPAVGPTGPDQPINLTVKTLRMLNELEKAHIYIEQLHERLASLEARLDEKKGDTP